MNRYWTSPRIAAVIFQRKRDSKEVLKGFIRTFKYIDFLKEYILWRSICTGASAKYAKRKQLLFSPHFPSLQREQYKHSFYGFSMKVQLPKMIDIICLICQAKPLGNFEFEKRVLFYRFANKVFCECHKDNCFSGSSKRCKTSQCYVQKTHSIGNEKCTNLPTL